MAAERETLDIDVLFVGAGPASLAGAYRLATLVAEHNAADDGHGHGHGHGEHHPLEVSIAVIEKGAEMGAHALSGAVVDPQALRELFPGEWREAPLEGEVKDEKLLWLTSKRAISVPVPPMLDNEGKYVASLGKLVKWMAGKVESAGVDVFTGFPGRSVLLDGQRVIGVRTGDRGIDKHGNKKSNYEPGVDIRSKVVVLGEGPRGTLTLQLEKSHGLMRGKNPQVYAIGVKEVWEIPGGLQPGDVAHTIGWPLDLHTFGGGFVYGMKDDLVIVGLVVGLDYRNPWLDPHQEFQRFKTHPEIASLLRRGKMHYYGAKAIPEGGWWSMPKLSGDGFLVIGDSGGFVNGQRLKGIHLAMKSGMLAAETIFDALLEGDTSSAQLGTFDDRVRDSWAGEELWEVRNFHQAFDHGTLAGITQAGIGMLTRGRGFGVVNRLHAEPGHTKMRRLNSPFEGDATPPAPVPFDGTLTFDKLADVYNSATAHEEDQPVHLLVHDTDICIYQCAVEYANPCQRFCPANVYEMVGDAASPTGQRLQINASNCVHCKTCDIMDPYQIITWVPPEGGGGPNYGKM
jgi:electron-transferring-flavoprotein dehydrogenase